MNDSMTGDRRLWMGDIKRSVRRRCWYDLCWSSANLLRIPNCSKGYNFWNIVQQFKLCVVLPLLSLMQSLSPLSVFTMKTVVSSYRVRWPVPLPDYGARSGLQKTTLQMPEDACSGSARTPITYPGHAQAQLFSFIDCALLSSVGPTNPPYCCHSLTHDDGLSIFTYLTTSSCSSTSPSPDASTPPPPPHPHPAPNPLHPLPATPNPPPKPPLAPPLCPKIPPFYLYPPPPTTPNPPHIPNNPNLHRRPPPPHNPPSHFLSNRLPHTERPRRFPR